MAGHIIMVAMIIYCCSDLLFATRISSTAEALGIGSRPARNAAALQARLDQVDDGKLNEPVKALLVDLDAPDALAIIVQAKAHANPPAVLAFGSHVMTDLLHEAREKGADFVMARGAFTGNLPEILDRFR